MELKYLRYFMVVAELQHITAAAEQLMVSQPFLTKIIHQLEAELGVELFDHVGRKIQLNAFGSAFYKHTQNILCELENAQAEIKEMSGRLTNTVNVITNVGLYMPPILATIQKMNSNFNLTQSSAKRFKIIEALQNGTADFAFCAPSLEAGADSGIVSENIMSDGVYVSFSPNHPLKHRKSVHITELNGLDYYTAPKGYGMRDYMDIEFAKAGVQPRIVIETTDTSSIINYVRVGMGFAFMPMSIVKLNPDLMKGRCLLKGYEYSNTSISWNEKIYKTKAHQEYLDLVRNHFKELQKPNYQP